MDPDHPSPANMSGGLFIGGNANAGHSIVAGNQTITGVQSQDLPNLFAAVYQGIDKAAAADPDLDPDLLKGEAKKIEQETARGDQADETVLRRSLKTLVQLAPDVARMVVDGLTTPGAAVASGISMLAQSFK